MALFLLLHYRSRCGMIYRDIGGNMKTWTIVEPEKLVMDESTLKFTEGTVKVKITRTAVSRTDVAIYLGKDVAKLPIIPCRIAAGLVSEAEANSKHHKGERVLLSPYIGNKAHGVDCNGFLRDYTIVPEEHLITIPQGISDDEVVFVDYVALATSCLAELKLKEHEYIAVIGTGIFSLVMAQLAAYHRAIPIIIGNSDKGLETARDMGISYCINSEKQDVQERVAEITCGKMADCTVFECVAGINPQFALSLTGVNGRVCITGFSAYMNKLSVDIRTVLSKKIRVVGVNDGRDTFWAALNLIANKAVTVKGLANAKESFDQAAEVFAKMASDPDEMHDILLVVE